jgi:hypothetical protein
MIIHWWASINTTLRSVHGDIFLGLYFDVLYVGVVSHTSNIRDQTYSGHRHTVYSHSVAFNYSVLQGINSQTNGVGTQKKITLHMNLASIMVFVYCLIEQREQARPCSRYWRGIARSRDESKCKTHKNRHRRNYTRDTNLKVVIEIMLEFM